MASVFLSIGFVQKSLMTNSNHSTSSHPVLHSSKEMAMFSRSTLFNTFFNSCIWCSFFRGKKSEQPLKKRMCPLLFKVRSIALKNSAGVSVSP